MLSARTPSRRSSKDIIRWTAELGIYVIMDWHVLTPGDPRDALYNTPPIDPKDSIAQ